MVTDDAPLWEDQRPGDDRVRCPDCGVYGTPHTHPTPVPEAEVVPILAALLAGAAAAAQRRRR